MQDGQTIGKVLLGCLQAHGLFGRDWAQLSATEQIALEAAAGEFLCEIEANPSEVLELEDEIEELEAEAKERLEADADRHISIDPPRTASIVHTAVAVDDRMERRFDKDFFAASVRIASP